MRRHLSLLCAGLASRGFALSIAAPPGFTLEGSRTPERLNILFPVPITARPHPLHDLRAALQTARCARQADLLHGHGLRGAWIAALAAHFARAPFLFTAHNLAPVPGRLTRALLGAALRRASAIIAVSQAVANSLAPLGLASEKIALIPNGIDLAPYDGDFRWPVLQSKPQNPRSKIVLSVGRLAPEKGFDTLIEAAPHVLAHSPDVRFIVAGDGPERDRLQNRVQERDLTDRFLLPGYVPDVPGLLSAADIVVVPSLSEGQGIVALEAMAARKPVVASRVGGLAETVEEGVTGLLVPPGDPAALADALLLLLEDAATRQRLGEAGRACVEARYTADRMVDSTAALYQRLVVQAKEIRKRA